MITLTPSETTDKLQMIADLQAAGFVAEIRGEMVDVHDDGSRYGEVIAASEIHLIKPSFEDQWNAVRKKRDQLLFACDWTQIADAPISDIKKIEWTSYRQYLRNIPQLFSDPSDIEWPVTPEE